MANSHYPQVIAMPTVPGPRSGHIQHLFQCEKIPQWWGPLIWWSG